MGQPAYDSEDSIDAWRLTPEDHVCIAGKSRANRVAFAVLLLFFRANGRFPEGGEIQPPVVDLVVQQLDIDTGSIADQAWSLHLLQNCMVYINTLMIQQVLARPHWAERLTVTDLRALTPLIWEHVNPYGRFELNMETRLDLNPNGPG